MTLVFDNNTAFDALQYETVDQYKDAYHVVVCKIAYALGAAGVPSVHKSAGSAGTDDSAPIWASLNVLPEAAPLLSEDEYFGEMHRSSVRQESDLAPYKPRCDVILNASAYVPHSPQGRPATQCTVRMIVQRPSTPAPLPEMPPSLNPHMSPSEPAMRAWRAELALAQRSRIPGERLIDKSLVVWGERWLTRPSANSNQWDITAPQAFSHLPLRYESAFGGEARINAGDAAAARVPNIARLSPAELAQHPDCEAAPALQPIAHSACETNLLGCGYSQEWYWQATQCQQLPAPRIEYPGQPLSAALFAKLAAPDAKQADFPAVAGVGCVGRAWLPRRHLIGQFQAKAQYAEDEYPELPRDFDFGYWNCAPRDQQCAHLRGDEEFALINLCPPQSPLASINTQHDTQLCFQLPGHIFYLALGDVQGRFALKPLLIDTVNIDLEKNRVEVVWRAVISTHANLTDAQLCFAETDEQLAQLHSILARQSEQAAEVSHGA